MYRCLAALASAFGAPRARLRDCAGVLRRACRQDMHDAPRYEPLEASAFFASGGSARPLVPNTVAARVAARGRMLYTGRVAGELADDVPHAGDRGRDGARTGAFQRVLLALSRAHRRGQRDDRAARLQAAAVVPRGAAAQCAGRLLLRRHDATALARCRTMRPRCPWRIAGRSSPTSARCSSVRAQRSADVPADRAATRSACESPARRAGGP